MERSQDELMNSSDGVRDSQGKPTHVAATHPHLALASPQREMSHGTRD